jgi:uncharacterized membrane protein
LAITRQRYLLLLVTAVGMAFALRLSFIEELVLQVWCVYCVISQALISLILLLGFGWFTWEYIELKRSSYRSY